MLQPNPALVFSSPFTFYGSTELEEELILSDPWNLAGTVELNFKHKPQIGLFIHWLDFDPALESEEFDEELT